MSTTYADAMQDAYEFEHGREVTVECTSCPRRWSVHLHDGEEPSETDRECPMRGCDGYGEER